MKFIPEINHLEELDPTHMNWEHEGGKVVESTKPIVEWPVYDEALGG